MPFKKKNVAYIPKRGVSAQKEEVHVLRQNLNKGLYQKHFVKFTRIILGGDQDFVNVMHADGAGTKSILAYLYWKETGDSSVWKGIAQDAIVMNIDDLLCAGIYNRLLYSSSIDRNKNRIPGEILKVIIEGSQEFLDNMRTHNVEIIFMGGETADVGDVVQTIAVNGTMTARWPKNKVITNEKIAPGNVIVGLASFGQSKYEKEYNSGIGSNGLTSARHDVLSEYYKQFLETFDQTLDDSVVYIGKHRLTDPVNSNFKKDQYSLNIGKLLLSPTRTYLPFAKELLENYFDHIYGMVHSSGGGQTKCMKYVPDSVKIIKDNLFTPPEIFKIIQQSSGSDDREMYQVFNMGCRLEIFTDESSASAIISLAQSFEIDAQIIGRVEASQKKSLLIKNRDHEILYDY